MTKDCGMVGRGTGGLTGEGVQAARTSPPAVPARPPVHMSRGAGFLSELAFMVEVFAKIVGVNFSVVSSRMAWVWSGLVGLDFPHILAPRCAARILVIPQLVTDCSTSHEGKF